jgi:catechol 2,3-dioxygenase-like lactoylglutathione lyase family enzyme
MALHPRGRPVRDQHAGLGDAPLIAFVATTDLDRAHAFYAGVLGLRRIEAGPFANAYDANGTSLRVTRVDRHATAPYTVLGWSVEDVHARVAALVRRGVAFRRYAGVDQDEAGIWTAPSGARVAWFEDPDGNLLSLTEAPPGPAPSGPYARSNANEPPGSGGSLH